MKVREYLDLEYDEKALLRKWFTDRGSMTLSEINAVGLIIAGDIKAMHNAAFFKNGKPRKNARQTVDRVWAGIQARDKACDKACGKVSV